MPNKYSHGLVFSQEQYRGVINVDRPPPPKPPSSFAPRSHANSATSIYSLADRSTRGSVNLDYTRFDPNLESAPSYSYRSAPHTRRPSFSSTPADAPQIHSTSSRPSRPASGRLRLESPLGFRWENRLSPPPTTEPELPEPSYHELPSSRLSSSASSPLGRLRLGDPSPPRSRSPRPSLHHKSSSLETQIYAPDPIQEGHDVSHTEADEPNSLHGPIDERQYQSPAPTPHERHNHTSPTSTHERQHVFSMESPKTCPHPSTPGDREERLSSDTQRTYLPSPIRNRQSFIQQTQASASPPPVYNRLANSPSGTQDTPSVPSYPSARDLHNHSSTETQDSHSTPAGIRDRQDVSTLKALPALPVPSQNDSVRPSLDIQRVQSPPRTREHSRRPSFERQHVSFDHRSQATPKSSHSRQQSSDSQTTRNRQNPPSLGARGLSSDRSIKEIPRSGRQYIRSQIAHEPQPSPSSGSQQLSLEQFIQESEQMGEPSIDAQMYSPQRSMSHAGNARSHQSNLASNQRYALKDTILEHGPQSHPDRPLELSDTFASQHRILRQDDYQNDLIETQGFPPERPPSPPATPKSKKSFLMTSKAEETQRTRPPPPIPQRSAWRSPSRQRSILRSANGSVDKLPLEPPRPKTSSSVDAPTNLSKATTLHSPNLSISTRKSSIGATTSPPFVPFSDFSETMSSRVRKSIGESKDEGYFDDADLEPLPSDVDYNVLPYEDPNTGPAIFRATQLGLENAVSPRYGGPGTKPTSIRATELDASFSHRSSVSSDASSFDSAAPPPIGLNRRITHATTESHPKTPKKESKLSLLSFLRSSTAPKAVLYSEATQGTPPVRVSLSKDRHNGLRGSGPEPRMRPSLDTKRSATRRSPAHIDAAEKRKSWYMGDDVEQIRAAIRMERKREFERILNNI